MITHLYVKNLAIIKETAVSFDKGFIVITGETGSGKSILLDALSLIGGARAGKEMIGVFGEKCIVEAKFTLNEVIRTYLNREQLDIYDDLIVRRELTNNGKSRVFLNDTPIQLATLRQLMSGVFYIHSQFSNTEIKSRRQQLNVIDLFGKLEADLEKFKVEFQQLQYLTSRLLELKSKYEELSNSKDYNSFLISEIDTLELDKINYFQLEEKLNKVEYSEKILDVINEIISLEKDNGSLDVFLRLKSSVLKISNKVDGFAEIEDTIIFLIDNLKNLISLAYSYDVELSLSVQEKEKLVSRIDEFNRLLNKHKSTSVQELKKVYLELQDFNVNIDELNHQINKLEKDEQDTQIKINDLANVLHKNRCSNVLEIESLINEKFIDLNMPEAKMKIHLSKRDQLNELGITDVSFLVSLNKGNDYFPLEKIASGGEMSRITLAIHNILSSKSNLPTILFDEIDAGIGGETATKIGDFLVGISKKRQVIVITHFAQVAAKADQHLLIQKITSDEKTNSILLDLDNNKREEELAKMISGSSSNLLAVETAKTLINEESAKN